MVVTLSRATGHCLRAAMLSEASYKQHGAPDQQNCSLAKSRRTLPSCKPSSISSRAESSAAGQTIFST